MRLSIITINYNYLEGLKKTIERAPALSPYASRYSTTSPKI